MNHIFDNTPNNDNNNNNLPVAYEITQTTQPYITVIPVIISDDGNNFNDIHDSLNQNTRTTRLERRNIIINNIRKIILVIMFFLFIYILSTIT